VAAYALDRSLPLAPRQLHGEAEAALILWRSASFARKWTAHAVTREKPYKSGLDKVAGGRRLSTFRASGERLAGSASKGIVSRRGRRCPAIHESGRAANRQRPPWFETAAVLITTLTGNPRSRKKTHRVEFNSGDECERHRKRASGKASTPNTTASGRPLLGSQKYCWPRSVADRGLKGRGRCGAQHLWAES